ncbi:GIY-YIG nuclease family protein [Tenacibaculum halocynthiae]|uniref:GIY-YIG nuclease family protein n=1 Tax=Tenacibaculum halocynthiae TaxID=1254437 RepID=UPI003894E944
MGKTIITHFLEGTPKGIQSIQLSNRTLISYIIPRSELKKCNELIELQTPCMYILFGENNKGNAKAYIGETDNFLERIANHNRKKDFWQKAFVFTTMASNLNKADILYLEYLAITLAEKVNNYDLSENKQNPKHPTLQRHSLDTMNEFFSDIKFIVEFGGYNIFKTVEKTTRLLFYTSGRKSEAKGFYDENGFTVLTGSIIANTTVASHSNPEKRESLIEKYTESVNGKTVLTKNIEFNSPSTAARFVYGGSRNGWLVWKTKNNKTLDQVFRK